MGKYSVLIIEDHALTRFGLRTAFESAEIFNRILEAQNAKNGIELIEKNPVDIVIMDLGLPDMNGIEATKLIKDKYSNIKVVILSSHEQEEDVIKSLRAGASAYCTKDVAPEKLIDIAQSVLKGAAWFDPKVADYVLKAATGTPSLPEQTEPEADKENLPDSQINLTAREKQVLALISEGYSNSEIAKKLEVSVNTTKTHVCNILQKLSVNDRTQAAIKAIKYNII